MLRDSAVQRSRIGFYLLIFAVITLVVYLTHLPHFDLPFYWDELGQFIPAALDLFTRGLWIPRSAVPNVHPPGVMMYLAAVWHTFGFSIVATRLAMLAAASLCAFVTFLLATQLCRKSGGMPAITSVLLLVVSPLFYTQAMLAELDMPAALFTVWALLLFLRNRYAAAAFVCTALVLVKETGVVVPAVFGLWLVLEGKRKRAAWFLLPALGLAGWLAVLWSGTGHPFGSSEFAAFNLFHPFHVVRLGFAFLRRAHYLFLENFHWIGWIAIAAAWRRSRIFRSRNWRVTATLALAHIVAVTILGGATLERYLMPALPMIYIAMAAAWMAAPSPWLRLGPVALAAGMLFTLTWNAPFPYPYENDLEMVDFVRIQQSAAAFLEKNDSDRTIATAWPFSRALRVPQLGYVSRPLRVKSIGDFGAKRVGTLAPGTFNLFALYSRDAETAWDFRRLPYFRGMAERFYGYEPQVPQQEIERRFGLVPVARWWQRGQWLVILAPKPPSGSAP